jgi:hypothetical protein
MQSREKPEVSSQTSITPEEVWAELDSESRGHAINILVQMAYNYVVAHSNDLHEGDNSSSTDTPKKNRIRQILFKV